MHEINFEFLVGYLEKEIERLNASKGSDAIDAVKKGTSEYLTQLLDWLKTAIRVERERIQGIRDTIDAHLYALMSKTSIKFDDDFKKMIDHARGNAATWLCKNPTTPQRKTYTASEVKEAGDRLENLRLKLKTRRADSVQQKITFCTQDLNLSCAVDILKNIAAEKAEAES